MAVESQVEDPTRTIKQKCAECIKGPNCIKTVIVILCVGVVLQQITVCVNKLIDVPITTYTHFDFNKTLLYPSVTFCREPAYKFDELEKYGLYSHPRITSTWADFDFDNVSLDDLWESITYNEKDYFVQYGLNESPENVEITPTVGFVFGRCFTMTPKILSTQAVEKLGYSVTLQHTRRDIDTSVGILPPGYHVYIHYKREPFTEVTVYNGGMVDSLYVNVGETMKVKLTVDQYQMISNSDDPCFDEANYSANECTTQYVWEQAMQVAGCSGPWMQTDLPRCSNYTAMRDVIRAYMALWENHECDSCPRICSSYLYNGFVTDRQKFYFWDSSIAKWTAAIGDAALETHLYIYFNSMMVSVHEERYNYDWNLFVSDLGGSIGFLLGLSVIGLMQIFGKTWNVFVVPFIKCNSNSTSGSTTSEATANVDSIKQSYMDKCTKWYQEQNLKE